VNGWKWRAVDLATGATGADVAVETWSSRDRQNESGEWSARLLLRGDVDLNRLTEQATRVARSTILPIRRGIPIGFEGVVWSRNLPDVAGAGLLSYLDRNTMSPRSFSWTDVDQHTMFVQLLAWLSTAGGDIRLDLSQVPLSGVLRTQLWQPWEAKNIGLALREKADNIGGFDFDLRAEGLDVDGDPVRRFRMWTPRRGRIYTDSASPVFTAGKGGNILDLPAQLELGAQMVSDVTALGDETNPTTHERRRQAAFRQDVRDAGYPRLEEVLDRYDVKVDASLLEQAQGWAAQFGAAPVDEITFRVDPDDETFGWGAWDQGDDCLLRIPGRVDGWFPDGRERVLRIVETKWDVDKDGERLYVTAGRVPT
jgi:hypothetical protein